MKRLVLQRTDWGCVAISSRACAGFTRAALISIVTLMLFLLVILFLGLRVDVGRKSRRIQCVNNLKNIALHLRIFSTDHGRDTQGFPNFFSRNEGTVDEGEILAYFRSFTNELGTPKVWHCPADVERTLGGWPVLGLTNVSYFLSANVLTQSAEAMPVGDRNLMTNGVLLERTVIRLKTNMVVRWSQAMHNRIGNVAFGDGSVQEMDQTRINEFLEGSMDSWPPVVFP